MKVEQEVDCSADDRDEDHMKEFISLSSLLTNLLQYVCEYEIYSMILLKRFKTNKLEEEKLCCLS